MSVPTIPCLVISVIIDKSFKLAGLLFLSILWELQLYFMVQYEVNMKAHRYKCCINAFHSHIFSLMNLTVKLFKSS